MNKSVSRRTFIGASAAAVAGAAAVQSAAQADRRVRIGVAGIGIRGGQLLHALRSIDGSHIVAICDDYRPHMDDARQTAPPDALRYDDFNRMLATESLDAIIVATPPDQQHSMCGAAIYRGLAVYCETPMGLTINEGRDLAAKAVARDAVFQVGLQRRANAVYEQAEAMIQTGMLGDITSVQCQWHVNDDEKRDVPVSVENPNHERLNRKLNWRLYREQSQGLMAEYGIHQLDVVNRMLGTAPRRVIAMGGTDYWRDGRDTYDNVHCTYEYEVGGNDAAARTIRASFSSILTNAYEGATELFMGTKGSLLLSPKLGLYSREQSDDTANAGIDGRSGATEKIPDSPWAHRGKATQITSTADGTRAALVAFVEAVAAGSRKTACDARTGLECLATALIANESIASSLPVSFPEDCRNESA